jgi:3-oxoacyl-[acyl-carrier protein] reductase
MRTVAVVSILGLPLGRVGKTSGYRQHDCIPGAFALGERGVGVNAVAPGAVPTEMSNFSKTEAGRDFTLGLQAFNRHTPEEIAAAIAFLASGQSQWITGDTLLVDGGSKL